MLQRSSRREARRRNQRRCEARQRVGIGMFLVPLTHQEIDVLLTVAQLFPVSNTLGVLPALPALPDSCSSCTAAGGVAPGFRGGDVV
jgi:hypothetical protein